MRQKVIDRLNAILQDQGYLDHEFLSFPAPTNLAQLNACTDEQLIELLECYGQFEG